MDLESPQAPPDAQGLEVEEPGWEAFSAQATPDEAELAPYASRAHQLPLRIHFPKTSTHRTPQQPLSSVAERFHELDPG